MTSFSEYLAHGNAWLFLPAAILLGALHGLEPGHSKTMMAAFIVAIRGTIGQAVMLGLSAAISHSLIIWILAATALHYGDQWNAETVEPYLQLGSAVMILGLAGWMFWRTRRELRAAAQHNGNDSHNHFDNDHDHNHAHSELFILNLGYGKLELTVFEAGVPPVFRLHAPAGELLPAARNVRLETVRPDGERQTFAFVEKSDFLESTTNIPEPHAFDATVTVEHGHHSHTCRVVFREDAHQHQHQHHHHHHDDDDGSQEFQDAHERAHAQDIAQRFAGKAVTTPQIILFGITGGLMPCPAAFTVLLVCLQLKQVTLGFAIVGAFSFGLALTMVAAGVLAAWSVRHAEKRYKGFGEIMRRAPYVSCVLLVALASFMAWHGWCALNH